MNLITRGTLIFVLLLAKVSFAEVVGCSDGRQVASSPFTPQDPAILCGEIAPPETVKNFGAPDSFVYLFGEATNVANSGLSGLRLQAARQEYRDKLARFGGVVRPDDLEEAGVNLKEAMSQGAIPTEFTTEYVERVAGTYNYRGAGFPVFYLMRNRAGEFTLWAKFVDLPESVSYGTKARGALKYPEYFAAQVQYRIRRAGLEVRNRSPLLN